MLTYGISSFILRPIDQISYRNCLVQIVIFQGEDGWFAPTVLYLIGWFRPRDLSRNRTGRTQVDLVNVSDVIKVISSLHSKCLHFLTLPCCIILKRQQSVRSITLSHDASEHNVFLKYLPSFPMTPDYFFLGLVTDRSPPL